MINPCARCKVLFVATSLRGGGAQRIVMTLATNLDQRLFDPALALVECVGPFLADIPIGFPVYDLGASHSRYAMPALLRLCWKLRPDIVISAQGHLNLLVIALRKFLPPSTRVIGAEHSVPSAVPCAAATKRLRYFLYKNLYRHADRITCPSVYSLKDLHHNFSVPLDVLVHMPNPVDTERIQKLAAEGPNPYESTCRNLVAVGRLVQVKGFDLLLKAFKALISRISNLHLTILGEGPERVALEALAAELRIDSKVTFAGFKRNPFPYFRHADLFVSASRREALPTVILEAFVCGTNVVATACPGGTAEIVENGETGLLVPPEDVDGLALGIEEALAKGFPVIGDELLRRVESTWGIGPVMQQYQDLLLGVANS